MAYVPVPNDLSRIKTKLAFNLTKRQLICFSIAGGIGIPFYLFTRSHIGNSTALFLMIGLMMPCFLFAMFEKDGLPFEKVLRKSQEWAGNDQMMYVVGATQGKAFEDIRRIAPHHFLLVPGIGAQGGSLEEVCKYGMTSECGLIVNSSRAIIYADATERFAQVAGEKAREVQAQMAQELDKYGI